MVNIILALKNEKRKRYFPLYVGIRVGIWLKIKVNINTKNNITVIEILTFLFQKTNDEGCAVNSKKEKKAHFEKID